MYKYMQVALTANEFDAIAINQATGMPAVSLPNGNVHLPVDLVPLFEQFKRITIWLGNSVKDKRMELQFANKLKRERCYFLPYVYLFIILSSVIIQLVI